MKDPVFVGPSSAGQGVFARRSFSSGETVGRITGAQTMAPPNGYQIEFGDELYWEPAAPFRYLNHSCEPNCEVWFVEDDDPLESELIVKTKRRVEPGEELCFDYQWPEDDPIRCACGTPSCRGWVVEDERVPHTRRAHYRALAKQKPAASLGKANFFHLLSARGQRFVRMETPKAGKAAQNEKLRVYEGLLDKKAEKRLRTALEKELYSVMRLHSRRMQNDDAKSQAPGSERHRVVSLVDEKRSVSKALEKTGVASLFRSIEFHDLAQSLSGMRLQRRFDVQIRCYEEGDHCASISLQKQDRKKAADGVDVQLTLCSPTVESQWIVYEDDGHFSRVANVAQPGVFSVYRTPFSHYTTPLVLRDSATRGTRWVISARLQRLGK
jgi:uncharacterized protein